MVITLHTVEYGVSDGTNSALMLVALHWCGIWPEHTLYYNTRIYLSMSIFAPEQSLPPSHKRKYVPKASRKAEISITANKELQQISIQQTSITTNKPVPYIGLLLHQSNVNTSIQLHNVGVKVSIIQAKRHPPHSVVPWMSLRYCY